MVQPLHRHDFFFMLVLKKAVGKHTIDFTNYPVVGNTIFLMRPGQVHQLTLKKSSVGYLLHFSNDFARLREHSANLWLRRVGNVNYYALEETSFKKIFPLLDTVFQEYTDRLQGYEHVIHASLETLFINLIRHQQVLQIPNEHTSYEQERLDHFLALLEDHMVAQKQVGFYAETLNLSPYQLNGITKRMLGKTCLELINEHIILEAKRNLSATTDQINQIAYQLGYDDPSYFIRFFKRHTGYSPNVFRQNRK